ncbi:hypothetical protein HIM_02041 [Hirsutella minnesotensis 3608]|nr:hypothetical protein HIM_02041 [Hirsutella minnesotensis 3608]
MARCCLDVPTIISIDRALGLENHKKSKVFVGRGPKSWALLACHSQGEHLIMRHVRPGLTLGGCLQIFSHSAECTKNSKVKLTAEYSHSASDVDHVPSGRTDTFARKYSMMLPSRCFSRIAEHKDPVDFMAALRAASHVPSGSRKHSALAQQRTELDETALEHGLDLRAASSSALNCPSLAAGPRGQPRTINGTWQLRSR